MPSWIYKNNWLYYIPTGQQWNIDYWDETDYAKFLAMDFDSQCGLLEQLEEVRS